MSPPQHQSSHTRCTWDDFSDFTSHPSNRTKCELHQGACKMTFQISPCVHLTWPSVSSTTPKFSREVHVRWLFKSHLTSILCAQVYPPPHQNSHMRCMQDDFSILTSCPSSITKSPLHHTKFLTQGAHKMTFQISPHIYLVWPSVPSTTPKFSHEVHMRWLFRFHLASI